MSICILAPRLWGTSVGTKEQGGSEVLRAGGDCPPGPAALRSRGLWLGVGNIRLGSGEVQSWGVRRDGCSLGGSGGGLCQPPRPLDMPKRWLWLVCRLLKANTHAHMHTRNSNKGKLTLYSKQIELCLLGMITFTFFFFAFLLKCTIKDIFFK